MAEKAAAVEKAVAEAEELPKAIVRRVVKEKLSQLSKEGDISVFREALVAFSESARIFIHYLSATANDVCKESKRQTINADDVFKALEEIEFPEFVVPLKASLEGMAVGGNFGPPCNCGAGRMRVRVARTNENYGRSFYRCLVL
ncbi:DNA polymerase II subunit B4 isoform X2 [Actinidia eriantha]|uniref:DNA polymerase II subunit B4 isoform X2 n=1 Tax=Actinidia eriantha TaxID=165200 RepID=UPI002583F66D|nr:DNA polymerase II subunit B4 isoform X2 [Actinidia eriantha]